MNACQIGMDMLITNMDSVIKHWATFSRRYPSAFPVVSYAFILKKRDWVRRTFQTCNFSLILRGHGRYRIDGEWREVEAPCVITQWPGRPVEYGPEGGDETWDEFYIIYHADLMPQFEKCGFVELQKPLWPIFAIAEVQRQTEELEIMARSPYPESMVDRVDRACERLILETLQRPVATPERAGAIARFIEEARGDLQHEVDLEAVAARNGMSPATFRRRWAELYPIPPARFVQQIRMREACRLLSETTLYIHEIAQRVGFGDEFYFSRRFRLETGMSPRDYRNALPQRGKSL